RPVSRTVSLMSLRSLASISSGSAEMSIESKPISRVRRMPSAVPTFEPNQAELISPSFTLFLPDDLLRAHRTMLVKGTIARLHQGDRVQVIARADGRRAIFGDRGEQLAHGSFEGVREPRFAPLGRDPAAGLLLGGELHGARRRIRI